MQTPPPPPPDPDDRESLADRVARWAKVVESLKSGWRFDLDDWLNDMDLRRTIDEAMAGTATRGDSARAALADRLAAIDRRFLRATADAGKCLWGTAAAAQEGWHAGRQWWYFRRPRAGNAALDREIDNVA